MRLTRLLTGGAAIVMLAGLSSSIASPAGAATKPRIIIGSTNFEEQAIVANLYGDVLSHAGYPVTVEPPSGTRAIVVPAIKSGQIDLEADYAGSLVNFLNGGTSTTVANNLATAIPSLKRSLGPSGVTVLTPAPALDTNVFAVTKATAQKDHLTTISSLKKYASKMILGGPPECPSNAGCLPGLEHTYGLHFSAFKPTDEASTISVAALKNGEVQVVELFSSDGNVVGNNFVALTDNKHLEAADYITPVIRKSVDSAQVAKLINRVSAKLTTAQISKLNVLVTGPKKEQAPAVAEAWLKAEHLI
jgi:osmoprotectant transport system substrate-binding protein